MRISELDLYVLADDYSGFNSIGLMAQHGLSILIKVVDSSERAHCALFDTGQVGNAVIRNAEILGIADCLRSVEAIVLSHSHYDHTGGLPEIVKYIGKKVFVIAHPDIVKPVMSISEKSVRLNVGLPFKLEEVSDYAYFLLLKDPLEVIPGVYYLGEIRRDPKFVPKTEGIYTVENGSVVKSDVRDDTGIAISVEGVGTVVIGGCSHSGIVNIAKQALRVTREGLHGVMGGFHLIESPKEHIRAVAEELRNLGVNEVVAGHCTGLNAECIFSEVLKDKFRKLHVGMHIHVRSRK